MNRKLLLALGSSFLILALNAGNQQTQVQVAGPDDFCNTRNTTFQNGEGLGFVVYYSLVGIYVNAANATVNVTTERLNNKPVYHIVAEGKTNSSYDWISKVNDKYESYIDTASMLPVKFVRKVEEGRHRNFESISFNRIANTVVTNQGVYKVPACIQDVLSSLYYARNINFDKYKPGDKIAFNMFIDNEVYAMYIRYVGRETVKTRYGKFKAIKFKPLLIKGTVFEGGEKMNVWVSDDANHIPLRVESPLSVGSIKVDMMSYRNLRYPLTSLKNLR
ncbi:MAG: hypothetical protein JWP69_1276 [Flaviaesturariibacter sp.]|nr:hypothetical protein [Flaviaesturariibacter sp.]